MRKILEITRKEFIQTFRDRKMLAIIFVAPVLQVILLGYAVTTDIKHIRTGIIDQDNSVDSRRMISRIFNCGYFDPAPAPANDKQIDSYFDHGRTDMVIKFPPDYSKKLKRHNPADIQVIVDGSDSNMAMIGVNYLNAIVMTENREYLEHVTAELSGRFGRQVQLPFLDSAVRIRYNPDLKSSHYMVPGVIALILTMTTMLLTSMALTREKELGTIEQILVSPIKPSELVIGKTLPFIVIGMADVLLVITAGLLIFNLPFRGNFWLLMSAALLFVLTTLGTGLFISTVSRTQQQALLTSFMVIFPSMILSGFVFPIDNMPVPVQPLSYFIPLRYFLVVIRSVILRGAGLNILWPQLAALAVFGSIIIVLSMLRFRKKLE